jgi:hypothetical protein
MYVDTIRMGKSGDWLVMVSAASSPFISGI